MQAARVLARSMTGKSVISLCVEDGEDVVGLPKTPGDLLSGLLGYVGKGGAVTLVPRGSQLSTLLSCTTLSPKLDRGRILPYRARVRDCTTCTLKPRCTSAPARKVSRDIDEPVRGCVRTLAKTRAIRTSRHERKRSKWPLPTSNASSSSTTCGSGASPSPNTSAYSSLWNSV